VGVGALVSILSLGDGVERFVRDQIESTTDLHVLSVASRTRESVDGLSLARERIIPLTLEHLSEVKEIVGARGTVSLADIHNARVRLTEDDVPRAALIWAGTIDTSLVPATTITYGRALSNRDVVDSIHVMIVSNTLAQALSPGAPARLVGMSAVLEGYLYQIVGVWPGRDAAPRAAIPITSGSPGRYPNLNIRAGRIEDLPALTEDIEQWLASKYGDWPADFTVQTGGMRLAQATQAIVVFKILMGSVAAVSILVGGIGITNIMLASVTERTREVGIRKAVGATRRNIRSQFIAESTTVAGVGSVLGLVLGWSVASLAARVMRGYTDAPVYASFNVGTIAITVGAALAVGIVFGTYPAMRAARLAPADAIRHE